MFFPRSDVPTVQPERLRSLRLSLDTPALSADGLDLGPARAAIVLYEDPGEGLAVAVVARSVEGSRRVCWHYEEAIEDGCAGSTIDAALTFAETMGFSFADDVLAGSDSELRRSALELWCDLVGLPVVEMTTEDVVEAAEAAEECVVAQAEAAEECVVAQAEAAEECVVAQAEAAEECAVAQAEAAEECVVAQADEAEVGVVAAWVAVGEDAAAAPVEATLLPDDGPPAEAALPLTKFRRRLGPALEEPPAAEKRSRGSALGRLRLVKRPRPGEAAERPSRWLRLLGSF